jgi:hypothetical protein
MTVEQFADRMQVSRTTVFDWIKNDALREGVHISALAKSFASAGRKAFSSTVGRSRFRRMKALQFTCRRVEVSWSLSVAKLRSTASLCLFGGPVINLDYR